MLSKVLSHRDAVTSLDPILLPENPTLNRPRVVPSWTALVIVVALTAYANFNFIWNQFYRDTPMLFDTAWYAHLVHRSSPLLQNPPPVTFGTIGRDFYATHFSPALWVLSWPTYLVPVSPETWIAILEALKYALLAMLVGLAIRSLGPNPAWAGPFQNLCAAAVVFLAAFNGVILASIAYPHFEGWFIVGALGFLFALFRKQTRLAAVLFGATLLFREDMGFHLCGLLVVITLAARWMRGRWDRQTRSWAVFAAIGFVWSVAALAIMKLNFPGDDALARVYLGSPPFAHLTWIEIGNRILAHAQVRAYFWLPLVVFIAWAIVRRCWWVLLGYVAFIPWIAVNFIARSQAAATLALYYSFPLAVAVLWPVFGYKAFANPGERFGLGWFAAALGLSIAGYVPNRLAPPEMSWSSMFYPVTNTRAALESVTQAIATAAAGGQTVGVDDAVAGLAPTGFKADNLLGMTPGEMDIAAFFSSGRLLQVCWEKTAHQPFHYRVHGTHMIVGSVDPLHWPKLDLISTRPDSLVAFLHGEAVDLSWSARGSGAPLRTVAEGPRLYFTAGKATVDFDLTLVGSPATAMNDNEVLCEVIATREQPIVVARHAFSLTELRAGENSVQHTIDFTIPEDQGAGLQIRVRAPAASVGRVRDVVLKTSPPPEARGNRGGGPQS